MISTSLALLTPEIKSNHAAMSRAWLEFVEYTAGCPESQLPESFRALERGERDNFLAGPLQSWPVFVAPGKRDELARASLAVHRLIKAIPERVFGNDPRRIAEFYNVGEDHALLLASILRQTDALPGAVGRGDFIETRSGLKCIEFNMVANLGGWEAATCAERYLKVPVIRRFLDQAGIAVHLTDPLRLLLAHVIADALAHGLAGSGARPGPGPGPESRPGPGPGSGSGEPLGLAVLFRPDKVPPAPWRAYMEQEFRSVLAEQDPALPGEIFIGPSGALELGPDGLLRHGEHRMHVVLDTENMIVPRPVFVAMMSGAARVFNGPLAGILSDKLNVALLSELAEAEVWSAGERAAIRAHIPWTRRVGEEFVDYRGARAWLPDLLLAAREDLVLKLGYSSQGADVHIGRTRSPAEWAALVETALREPSWLVQEYLESLHYMFLRRDGGGAPHNLVWGLFTFGPTYGGAFLRMAPAGLAEVINQTRGLDSGVYFDVAE
jgi:hypothetical protein